MESTNIQLNIWHFLIAESQHISWKTQQNIYLQKEVKKKSQYNIIVQ